MKAKIIYIIALFLVSIGMLQAQEKLFNKLADNDNVSVVYISKALLNMVPEFESAGGTDIGQLADKLEQIEIYTCEGDIKTINIMRSEMESLTKSKTYESLMTIKEKKQSVNFLGYKQNDKFKDLIMYVNEDQSCTIIRIKGSFTSSDIKKVVKSSTGKTK